MNTLSNRLFNQRGWKRELKKAAVLGVVLSVLLLFAGRHQIVHAASLTVTTTDDELNTDGDCSLREAIQAANTDTAVDACFAGSGADTIVLPAGTYSLSIAGAGEHANATGDLNITSDLTLQGDGAATTILDGADLDRVLNIFAGQVQISGVTIRNGSAEFGSGIFNHGGTLEIYNSIIRSNDAIVKGGIFNGSLGTATIKNSTISENTGSHGGISNEGTVTILDSTFSNNVVTNDLGGAIGNGDTGIMTIEGSNFSGNSSARGGAIFNWGSISITGSSFTGNTAGSGGAITNSGSGIATIDNSNFWDNSADNGPGGGIENVGSLSVTGNSFIGNTATCCGGAISNSEPGLATIDKSTFSENSAPDGGAIFNFGGDLTLISVTVKNNTANFGGGIFNSDSLSLIKSIVTGNSATSGPGSGGGIFNNGTVTLTKSKVRNNQPDNCVGC